MFQFIMNTFSSIIVEAYRKRNYILCNHITINFVFKIHLRIVLELFEAGRWEECKAMTLKDGTRKHVHHLNQCTVKHFDGIGSFFHKESVYFIVGAILQCTRNIAIARERGDFFKIAPM